MIYRNGFFYFVGICSGRCFPVGRADFISTTDSYFRAVLFHEVINDLGLTDLENPEVLAKEKNNLLGKEMIFSGNVRNNAFFNTLELIIDNMEEANLDEIIAELEK